MSEGKEVSGVAPRADVSPAANPRATDAASDVGTGQLHERDDMTNCEHCDKEFPFDAAVSTADGCYLCPECDAAWRSLFDACSHDWEPHYDSMGDSGRFCRRCHGFVADESPKRGPRFNAGKWVRVMADFCSSGLWDHGGANISVSDVPISREIAWDLGAWQAGYDLKCEDYLPAEERTKTFDVSRHSAEGLRIARAIKAELPDWTVIYFDESRCDSAGTENRSAFEYEITAQGMEAGTGETRSGSTAEGGESPVGAADAPNPSLSHPDTQEG